MEYWLNEIDNQKKTHKNKFKDNTPRLPVKISDPHQQTAAWIIEHKKIWANMHKIHLNESRFSRQINDSPQKANSSKSSKNKNKSEAFFAKQTSRRRTQCYEELDAKTQLLINYARIDAITNTKLDKMFESKNPKKLFSSFASIFAKTDKTKECPDKREKKQSDDAFLSISNDISRYSKSSLAYSFQSRKRRHSWPRCKSDNLNLNNNNRKLRLYYQEQARKQRQMQIKKQYNHPDYELWFEHREEFVNLV